MGNSLSPERASLVNRVLSLRMARRMSSSVSPRASCVRQLAPVLLASVAFANPAVALPRVFAAQLTPENIAELRVGGSDAIGGLDDWAIGNGTVCAVVSDPSHEAQLSVQGGVLVDLGHCDAANDEWVLAQSLVNISRQLVLPVTHVAVERDGKDGIARLVTRGTLLGLSVETRYQLDLERPDALQIETRVERLPDAPDGARAFLFGDVLTHGRRQLAPFTLELPPRATELSLPPLPAGSVGFQHPDVDPDDLLTMIGAILPANLHVLVGGDQIAPGVSYGLRVVSAKFESADGTLRDVPYFSINGESFTLLGALANPVWVGGKSGAGLLELAQTIFMDIEPGERLFFTREVLVGRRADVASVTDLVWPNAPLVHGTTEPAARIHVSTRAGTPVTEVRPDADGSFTFRVPPGRYALRVPAPGGREVVREIEVGEAGLALGPIEPSARAGVALPRGEPMRLVFVPAETGRPAPRFGDDLLGFSVGATEFGAGTLSDHISLAGIPSDPSEITLAEGRYTVYATRGPEFSVTQTTVEAKAGTVTPLSIEAPLRVLDHPGFTSVDLHVHALESNDSSLPLVQRIAAFVAAGAEVIVSTEHDRVSDYGPLIAKLGLDDEIASVVGVEITSTVHGGDAPHSLGHANAYPVVHRPLEYRGGAPRAEGRRLGALAADIRALPTGALLQLNHPRSRSGDVKDLNFFTHLSVSGEPFQPTLPLSAAPNRTLLERDPGGGLRDLDFDLIEVMNGHSMRQFLMTRADWYALLLQGEFRPAVANSDSHVARELVALPRTLVETPDVSAFDAKTFDEKAFIAALRAGRAYGTTGPLLAVRLRSPANETVGLGGLLHAKEATLEIEVDAADWVPVSRLRVLENGAPLHEGPIQAGETFTLPVAFDADAFLTIEVSGEPGPVFAAVAPRFEPFAFTNPLFIDADGDGRWTAPGLPQEPLAILEPFANSLGSGS